MLRETISWKMIYYLWKNKMTLIHNLISVQLSFNSAKYYTNLKINLELVAFIIKKIIIIIILMRTVKSSINRIN